MTFEGTAIRHPEYGSKHSCVSCAARFYDLRKIPAVCPKCGTAQPLAPVRVSPPRRPAPARLAARPVPVIAEEADDAAMADGLGADEETEETEEDDEAIDETDDEGLPDETPD